MGPLKGRLGPGKTRPPQPALHRTIIFTDVERFGDQERTNPDLIAIRDGLYQSLRDAFARSGVSWHDFYYEDRGDGVLILVPPEVPKEVLVTRIPRELAAALSEHNGTPRVQARFRLRMAVHAGEVCFDAHGVVGAAIIHAARLLESDWLKDALASSSRSLAVIASERFFDEVIRHLPASSYKPVPVSVKETMTTGWICLPEDSYSHLQAAVPPSARLVPAPRRSSAAIADADHATDMRAEFHHDQLSVQAERLSRLLRLHPGPDITVPAAASLAALPERQAHNALAELIRANQVTEPVPGRFAFRCPRRMYATGQDDCHNTDADQHEAEHRMFDHYLHAAHAAAERLYPRWDPVSLAAVQSRVTAERCAEYPAAWAWFEAEHQVLLTVIQKAAVAGYSTHAWQLSWMLMDYFDRRGYWHELAAIQHVALKAASDRADQRGEAYIHQGLGISYRWLGRYDEARAHLRWSLDLFVELRDQVGQADTLSGFIWWFQYRRCHQAALRRAEQALALYRAVGHRAGEAHALSDIAWSHTLLQHDDQALISGQQARSLFEERGDPHGEAHLLDTLGYAHSHLRDRKAAGYCCQGSLEMHTELCDPYHQSVALDHLGDIRCADGRTSAARTAWQAALDNLGHLPPLGQCPDGYPDVGQIRVKLERGC